MTTPATSTLTLPDKFDQVENIISGTILEKKRIIEVIVTALVARMHHVNISTPGTAKTMMIKLLISLIDGGRGFRWFLTRFSVPEEMFGPYSLKKLEQDEYVRNTLGKLPEADIAFLDEFFKANSAILNSLLTIMNEGEFFNNGIQVCKPTIYAASNEIPREAELAALWDRCSFRTIDTPIREKSNKIKMLKARAARHINDKPLEPVLTWDEVLAARVAADAVEIPDDVFEAMVRLEFQLAKAGVEISPRRLNDAVPVIKATAWRHRRSVAEIEDLRLLRYMWWMDVKDIPAVDNAVLGLANPLDKAALELMETVEKLAAEAEDLLKDTDNLTARRKKGIEINGKLERCGQELDKLQAQVEKSKKRSDMVTEARTRLKSVVERLLSDLFPGVKAE